MSTSTSRRGVRRGRRRYPGQPQRFADPARAWPRRRARAAWACDRWPGISAAGTTAGRSCARRSASAVVESSASPTTRCTAPTFWPRWCARFPPERLHVGHRLTALVDHGDRVEADVRERLAVEVDVLVGADGIHSGVRRRLVRPGEAAVHRLRRLPRPGAGRAARPLGSRGRRRRSGWGRAGTSSTTTCRSGGSSTSSRSSSRTPGRASPGPTAARSPTRSPPSKAGIRRFARSSEPSTRPSSGRCSTAPPLRAGRRAA